MGQERERANGAGLLPALVDCSAQTLALGLAGGAAIVGYAVTPSDQRKPLRQLFD